MQNAHENSCVRVSLLIKLSFFVFTNIIKMKRKRESCNTENHLIVINDVTDQVNFVEDTLQMF